MWSAWRLRMSPGIGEALSNQPLALGFTPINDLGTIQSPVSNRTALLHCREADQKRP